LYNLQNLNHSDTMLEILKIVKQKNILNYIRHFDIKLVLLSAYKSREI